MTSTPRFSWPKSVPQNLWAQFGHTSAVFVPPNLHPPRDAVGHTGPATDRAELEKGRSNEERK
jgi:hypothetical protein